MGSRAQRRFVERELPELVEAGVVPPDVAARLREHCAAAPARGLAVPLFAVLGAALIGLGVILLLAANWEALTRPLRAALCFALLLLAQALAGFALVRRPRAAAWGEATALGVSLAAAAATALVAQTYQVQGDLRSFLTTWLLLSLPLPYLFDARGVAALILFGAGGWLALSLDERGTPLLFWGFLALLAPYLLSLRGRTEAPLRNAFLASVAVAALAFGSVMGFRIVRAELLLLLASLVAAGVYALGSIPQRGMADGAHAGSASTPSSRLAGVAIVAALLALGFRDAWGFVGELATGRGDASAIDHIGASLVAVGFAGLAARGLRRQLRARDWPRALVTSFPLLLAAGIVGVTSTDAELFGAALASVWTLALAIATALVGMAEADLRRANAGILLLAALVFLRFADWDLSFTLRGLVFIGFGLGFLLVNLHLRRRRSGGMPSGAPGGPV